MMKWEGMFNDTIKNLLPPGKEKPGVFPKTHESMAGETSTEDLDAQKDVAQENYQKYLRVYAELINYKKQVERERKKLQEKAEEGLMRDLLPLIDSLEKAIEHSSPEENQQVQPFLEGIQLALKDLLAILRKYGLEPIEAKGQPFDPNQHEALAMRPSAFHPPQTVIEELRKGYLFKDQLLRPSQVIVASAPEDNPEKNLEDHKERPEAMGNTENEWS